MLFQLAAGDFSSKKLEQLEFKLEKNYWIYKHAGKVRKVFFCWKVKVSLTL